MSKLRGSCLCGALGFSISGPVQGIGSCHCSKCRKVSGTGGNAQFMVSIDNFEWTRGEDNVEKFQLPDGWGPTRCSTCGSPIPESYDDGKHMWVPAGLMDDELHTEIKMHIFCGSRADWDKESQFAKNFDEYPL